MSARGRPPGWADADEEQGQAGDNPILRGKVASGAARASDPVQAGTIPGTFPILALQRISAATMIPRRLVAAGSADLGRWAARGLLAMDDRAQTAPARLWAGRILSGLVVAFLVFDAVTKIIKVAPVVEATEKLGIPGDAVAGIGIVLLTCTAIYAAPRTAVLGAILLTGYLGGAAAIHVRSGSGTFPVAFSVAFGVLAWLALLLREPRRLGVILLGR